MFDINALGTKIFKIQVSHGKIALTVTIFGYTLREKEMFIQVLSTER